MKKRPAKSSINNVKAGAKTGLLVVVAVVLAIGVVDCGYLVKNWVEDLIGPKDISLAELVDSAMALSGAIVISPHRELSTIGDDFGESGTLKVAAPSIGVHTPNGWCVWSLGTNAVGDFQNMVVDGAYHFSIFGSKSSYQSGYVNFMHCVTGA